MNNLMAFSNAPSSCDARPHFYSELLDGKWKNALSILRSFSETIWVEILSQVLEIYRPWQLESPVFHQLAFHYIVAQKYNDLLSSILETLKQREPEKVPLLLETRDALGDTPLMIAVREGRSKTAKILLDHGAKINARNNMSEMPLFLAIAHGEVEIVEEMTREEIDKGWFEKDSYARTPMHHALISAIQGPQNYLRQEYEKQRRAYGDQKNGSLWIIGQMEQDLSSAKVRRRRAMAVLKCVFSYCLNLYCLRPNCPDKYMDDMWVTFIEIAMENFDIEILEFLLMRTENNREYA
ncbi:hypothetical protein N7523_005767 [Penicillium sp. IBT 18751x]|nr:hypothetical protein N7523_005641 [Penicillium sp. IBT 18751x]KAJ6118016.1 hypothetical protein N7523_005767 [Penicillium sp. IBT 18751x]